MTTDVQRREERERILFLKKVNTANVSASVYAFPFISQSHKRTLKKSTNPHPKAILKFAFRMHYHPFLHLPLLFLVFGHLQLVLFPLKFFLKMPGNRDNVKTTCVCVCVCVLNVWKGRPGGLPSILTFILMLVVSSEKEAMS